MRRSSSPASGDADPQNKTLGTFNALFPRGSYFSEADLLGPYNLMDLHPSVSLKLTKSVTVTPDLDFFWRESTKDGIYSALGKLLRSGQISSARYIGNHANIEVEWAPTRHLSFTGVYLHFFPGPFLEQTKPGEPVNFVALWATYRV